MDEFTTYQLFVEGDTTGVEMNKLLNLLQEGWEIISTASTQSRVVYILQKHTPLPTMPLMKTNLHGSGICQNGGCLVCYPEQKKWNGSGNTNTTGG